MKDNQNFKKEVMEEADKRVGGRAGVKDLADAIGMPDEKDKEYILKLIYNFEKKNPGVLKHIVTEAREDFRSQGGKVSEYGLVNEAAGGRTLFEIPEELMSKIEQAYPTMFREKKHFHWFVKNFKALLIPEKY